MGFNRHKTHNADTETAPEPAVGLNFEEALFAIFKSVPADMFGTSFVLMQFKLERDLRNVLIEPVSHLVGYFGRCKYDPYLGIMEDCPGIEVQRSNEDPFSIKNK